jgi:hypothetical protein
MLMRGRDTHGHWKPEMRPKADFDPACLAELDRVFALYNTAPVDLSVGSNDNAQCGGRSIVIRRRYAQRLGRGK